VSPPTDPDSPPSDAYYLPLGDGRYRATEHTSGPWDPAAQHGGPPSALLGHALTQAAVGEGMVFARLTFELLGPVPVDELEVEAAVTRPGRRVEMSEATMRAGGRDVMRARAWRVAGATAEAVRDGYEPPPRPDRESVLPDRWPGSGYLRSVEWRFAEGRFGPAGPAKVWTRMRVPLLPGEEPDPLTRVLVVADSGSGVSSVLDWDDWLFINPELTVHCLRPPAGEWICLDAATTIEPGGAGLTRSTLSDGSGPVAHGAQSLLVQRR
jgi:hypothetical protein